LVLCFILLGIPAFAEPPEVEEVLGALEMDKGQIAEQAQGQPIAYALSEDSADVLDDDVTALGLLTEHGGASSLASIVPVMS
jgi:hypothetical protein